MAASVVSVCLFSPGGARIPGSMAYVGTGRHNLPGDRVSPTPPSQAVYVEFPNIVKFVMEAL